ncbi:hypothetical protein [Actinoplanes sp. NBRC 101535]|uniref:hypothetical protein n=1 Tax=Actinoplanes sp. NBRC 101535 TaxID=3032196 RepID=UPI0024A0E952|nr:hypothetical protein [Actinoplanes sp. NBRC 101535]GLY07727.1 hypothetical protein Acsp01_81060 [Actinoplanes sp. NBRC 101535]
MSSFPWYDGIAGVLVLGTWVAAWWRSRRFRLRFALLAPAAAIAGIVLALVVTVETGRAAAGSCAGTDCHDVAGFTARLDSPDGFAGLLGANATVALFVAVPLTAVTLIVEYILLVRRQNREDRALAEEARRRREASRGA